MFMSVVEARVFGGIGFLLLAVVILTVRPRQESFQNPAVRRTTPEAARDLPISVNTPFPEIQDEGEIEASDAPPVHPPTPHACGTGPSGLRYIPPGFSGVHVDVGPPR